MPKQVILPTADAIRSHSETYGDMGRRGIPFMVVAEYLLHLAAYENDVPAEDIAPLELGMAMMEYLNEVLGFEMTLPSDFVQRMGEACAALFGALCGVRQAMLGGTWDEPRSFVSGVSMRGWLGQDIIADIEVSSYGYRHGHHG